MVAEKNRSGKDAVAEMAWSRQGRVLWTKPDSASTVSGKIQVLAILDPDEQDGSDNDTRRRGPIVVGKRSGPKGTEKEI